MRGYAHIKRMNTIVIVVAAVSVVILITVIVIICIIVSGQSRHKNQYQNQSKSVLVKNGVDVKKQVLGGEKGEYFTGNLEKQGTCYVNSDVRVWRVVFDNLGTGERSYVDFVRQMRIGRVAPGQNEPVKYLISGDGKVSRNHCMIYENGGILYLKDLQSSNHTYLNGNIVTNATCLGNGDVIRVGNTQIRVQYSIINNRPT